MNTSSLRANRCQTSTVQTLSSSSLHFPNGTGHLRAWVLFSKLLPCRSSVQETHPTIWSTSLTTVFAHVHWQQIVHAEQTIQIISIYSVQLGGMHFYISVVPNLKAKVCAAGTLWSFNASFLQCAPVALPQSSCSVYEQSVISERWLRIVWRCVSAWGSLDVNGLSILATTAAVIVVGPQYILRTSTSMRSFPLQLFGVWNPCISRRRSS